MGLFTKLGMSDIYSFDRKMVWTFILLLFKRGLLNAESVEESSLSCLMAS